jgi:hypothetical protein
MISPRVAPTKNRGIINPPRHPEVTVMAMAMILKTRIPNNRVMGNSLSRSALIS